MDAGQDGSGAQRDPEQLEGRGVISPVTAQAQDDTAQQPAQEVARLLQRHLPAILTHKVPLQETGVAGQAARTPPYWSPQKVRLEGGPRCPVPIPPWTEGEVGAERAQETGSRSHSVVS